VSDYSVENNTFHIGKGKVTGLEWPRGFEEVKVPRLGEKGTGWR
jgi:hypothetical protein